MMINTELLPNKLGDFRGFKPYRQQAMVSQEFNFQLMVLNNSSIAAEEIVVTFSLPPQLVYLGSVPDSGADVTYHVGRNELTWKIPKLEANESISQWLRVQGETSGEAMTTARVSGRQTDSNLANNEAQAKVDIITFFVPNVFTPNGDGVNDMFRIVGLESFKSNKLFVFNRVGYEVYRSENYQNDWNGEGLHEGTYFYYLELTDWTGKVHRHRGYVLLARKITVQ